MPRHITRRTVLGSAAAALAGCATAPRGASDGRLVQRPRAAVAPIARRGEFRLEGWPGPRVFVPQGADTSKPAPLILALHGGGGDSTWMLRRMAGAAQRRGVVLLAPDAHRDTWEAVKAFHALGANGAPPDFSADAGRIDAALGLTFAQATVDPGRIAVAGFSDGASLALSLGPRNPDLFTHIIGFSPGGVAPFADAPHAKVFVSHGTRDRMLPFANSAEGVVPGFRARGFAVTFETFEGGHEFRDAEIESAMAWFLS